MVEILREQYLVYQYIVFANVFQGGVGDMNSREKMVVRALAQVRGKNENAIQLGMVILTMEFQDVIAAIEEEDNDVIIDRPSMPLSVRSFAKRLSFERPS